MKNYLFLLFGFGFLFAGTSRFVSDLLLPNNEKYNAPETSINPSDVQNMDGVASIATVRQTAAPTAANDFPSSGGRLTVNQEEMAPSSTAVSDKNTEDPFISNSFLTVGDESYRNSADFIETNLVPDRIVIPKIHLDAPIVPSNSRKVNVDGKVFDQWLAPNLMAAGWQTNSAHLGEVGNTVINGHHNEFGEVFKRLIDLDSGDEIIMYSGEKKFVYVIANRLVLPERKMKLETRISNARWIQHSNDERLTLVTCWPYDNNTHRLILVAVPNR